MGYAERFRLYSCAGVQTGPHCILCYKAHRDDLPPQIKREGGKYPLDLRFDRAYISGRQDGRASTQIAHLATVSVQHPPLRDVLADDTMAAIASGTFVVHLTVVIPPVVDVGVPEDGAIADRTKHKPLPPST